jgi:hypothetical protein
VDTPYRLLVSDFHLANSFSNEVRRVNSFLPFLHGCFDENFCDSIARTGVRIEPFKRGLAKIDEIS